MLRAIDAFLSERERKLLLRSLHPAGFRREGKICINCRTYFDFCSNDYLGLANHPRLKDAYKKAIEKFGIGVCSSRLLSGDLEIHHELEEKIAIFKGKENALIFNSGYQANVGIISALFSRKDAIFSDRLNHASIVDGIMLSKAKLFRFQHNDIGHLELLLKKNRHKFKDALIITETVFSMDGDRALIKELVGLKEKYDCSIMVDEAHSTGIFGENGSGVVEEEGLADKIDFIMGTFSKGLGGFGAYLASSDIIKKYLINSCRSFIYSTALPPAIISANLVSLELVREEPFRRHILLDNARFFRDSLMEKGLCVKGDSQIVPLITGDNESAVKISRKLRDKGYWVLPIMPPTVPKGQARLRFSLSYEHNRCILEELINDLVGIML